MASPFDLVERGLQECRPDTWRRLTAQELSADFLWAFRSGWRVDLQAGEVSIAGVDHLLFVIDAAFPNSQPRVFAPGAGSDFRWPHVERFGLLCLRPTSLFADVADRIGVHLADALELLTYSAAECQAEFEREFLAYWAQQAVSASSSPQILSLLKPGGEARTIYQYFDYRAGKCVVADDKTQLKDWLRNCGVNAGDKDILPATLLKLSRPLTPAQFPRSGGDLVQELTDDVLRRSLVPGRRPLFILEAHTPTGPAFVAVIYKSGAIDALTRGFRNITHVPGDRIRGWFKGRAIERVVVNRVDGPWIHGRDHSSDFLELNRRRVVVVGCGAIGSAVANLLAQAGVGELIFVDGDEIHSANASRHFLGVDSLRVDKVTGLARALARKFPHLTFDHAYPFRFERLPVQHLARIADADLIIAAGLDLEGEAALDAWRASLPCPPAYLSAWAEAYAMAGHAVLLYGPERLMSQFDVDERPSFRLTDWPDESGAIVVEAGCGNVFQPHGAVDLHPTIGMAAGLALDALLGRVPNSCRRVWMGSRERVEPLGGTLRAAFDKANTVQEYAW
ncbi:MULTISPECIES: ThiF family adenylyltransferase [Pseudomonas]|uniref:ThiF family protein n=1 Tax=Pseudomonas fluorescens TaxID=294 RepID=A0A3S4NN37_PSEFL|nr:MULTISPECIES: ThiF family adenylyltransferase [Pseudomonas]VEE47698.1 ThiF family protein [Pseudomonas fluorescens]ERV42743.1 hypothetical protein Q065_03460 [Pseudomonas aeruginosa BL11]ERY44046.1 hypothetical protein Q060_05753 [Pseudomonas aeruginosa BL06]MBG5820861.1 ThiF family adenylyltransferase [Pseudomonas aeruginosa]MBH8679631.1 ThiF family adenylyltransferase [Pseudomonas aeruginosa]